MWNHSILNVVSRDLFFWIHCRFLEIIYTAVFMVHLFSLLDNSMLCEFIHFFVGWYVGAFVCLFHFRLVYVLFLLIEDQDHDQHDLRKSLFWLSVVSKVRVHCGKGRHSRRWQEQEAGTSFVYTQETGERVHTGSKAAPLKGSTASLNSATNWEPSVVMWVFVRHHSPRQLDLCWHIQTHMRYRSCYRALMESTLVLWVFTSKTVEYIPKREV